MQLRVETTFEASHQLFDGVPVYSLCRRLHGHSYRVSVCLDARPPDDGVIFDTDRVRTIVAELFDHRHLNEVLADRCPERANPTVENVALLLKKVLGEELPDGVIIYRLEIREGFNGAAALVGSGAY